VKYYEVQIKFEKEWFTLEVFKKQVEALHHVKVRVSENDRYPMRIVRVDKTVVFEGK